jgi:hypothetical protein
MTEIKQEPVDNDDLQSVDGSEWTLDTSYADVSGNYYNDAKQNEAMLKVALLEVLHF